jgi:hypothetical protein
LAAAELLQLEDQIRHLIPLLQLVEELEDLFLDHLVNLEDLAAAAVLQAALVAKEI